MSNKLAIVFSGKKQAGKDSAAQFTLAEYLNRRIGKSRFSLDKSGKEIVIIDGFNRDQVIPVMYPNPLMQQLTDTYSVKLYTFSDPLKEFCIDSFGLDPIQCYGSDDDRNSTTHISWEDLFDQIREKYSRPRRGTGGMKPASGFMTAKEVMDVMENDIFRRVDINCWARSLYSLIDKDGYDLAIVTNAAYPNEVTLGVERGAKVVRLLRDIGKHPDEDPLEDFPLGEFSLVLDNKNTGMVETHAKLRKHVNNWFEERHLV